MTAEQQNSRSGFIVEDFAALSERRPPRGLTTMLATPAGM
jgi:hypothetical protein